MGEAKRRKALGLMPTVENHDVIFQRDGTVEANTLPAVVLERLSTWAESGARWDARYRTSFIGTGLPRELLKTEDDLMNIPVPDRMRLRLGLLSGSPAWVEREREANPDAFFEENGELTRQLNIRATEYDYNGHWAALPEFEADGTLRYLMQHPAVSAPPQGTDYEATVWHGGERGGQVELEPEPDAQHHDALAGAARDLLGQEDEAWLEDHQDMLDDEMGEENEGAPLARRITIRLAPVPLVLSPAIQVVERSGDMDVVYTDGPESYTHDGQTWHDYPEQVDRQAQLQALLAQMGLGELGDLEGLLGQGLDLDDLDADETGDDGRTIDAEVVRTEPRITEAGNTEAGNTDSESDDASRI